MPTLTNKKLIELSDRVEPECHLDRKIASLKKSVRAFFHDVRDGCGKPFRDADIFTPQRLDMMLTLDWETGVQIIYEAIDHHSTAEQKRQIEKLGKVEPDVEMLLEGLYKAARCVIPMQHRIGVVATFVELTMKKDVYSLWENFRNRPEKATQAA